MSHLHEHIKALHPGGVLALTVGIVGIIAMICLAIILISTRQAHYVQNQDTAQQKQPSFGLADSSMWSIYSNGMFWNDRVFTFKYPSYMSYKDYLVTQNRLLLGEYSVRGSNVGATEPYFWTMVELKVYPFAPHMSVSAASNLDESVRPVWKTRSVGSKEVIQVNHLGCASGDCLNLLLIYRDKLFDFGVEQGSDFQNQKLLDTVVSTVEFTE